MISRNSTNITTEALFDLFLYMEKKYRLFEQRTSEGIYFWKLVRFGLFNSVRYQLGLYEEIKKSDTRLSFFTKIYYSLKSAYFVRRYVNSIVIIHNRKINQSGVLLDPITMPIIEEKKYYNEKILIVEDAASSTSIFNDARYYRKTLIDDTITKLTKVKKDDIKNANSIMKEVCSCISEYCGIKIEYKKLSRVIKRFKAQKIFWESVFYKTKCKEMYIVCSYGKEGIISAAQESGVRVVEIQHGMISRYHAGYSFGMKNIPYFPDFLYLFGKKWYGPHIPVNIDKIRWYGYPQLNQNVQPYIGREKEKKVLFISQWTLNARMVHYADMLSKEVGREIIFKFHPRDSDETMDTYKKKYPDIKFIKNEYSLHDLLSKCEYIIGVFSTAIFEAAALDCKIILLNEPGVESLEDFITDFSLPVVSDSSELIHIIKRNGGIAIRKDKLNNWFEGLI